MDSKLVKKVNTINITSSESEVIVSNNNKNKPLVESEILQDMRLQFNMRVQLNINLREKIYERLKRYECLQKRLKDIQKI